MKIMEKYNKKVEEILAELRRGVTLETLNLKNIKRLTHYGIPALKQLQESLYEEYTHHLECQAHPVATILSDPMESIITYQCPQCGDTHDLEADAGEIDCNGHKLMCTIEVCL